MTNDNPTPCSAVHSCTDSLCHEHRYDLLSALLAVADAWLESLPDLDSRDPGITQRAFVEIARLAAAEVLP